MTEQSHAATSQESAVIAAARLVVATYPLVPSPSSDIDYYVGRLRDELALLDKERES